LSAAIASSVSSRGESGSDEPKTALVGLVVACEPPAVGAESKLAAEESMVEPAEFDEFKRAVSGELAELRQVHAWLTSLARGSLRQ
jgi:hypothetical protein